MKQLRVPQLENEVVVRMNEAANYEDEQTRRAWPIPLSEWMGRCVIFCPFRNDLGI